MHAMASNSTDSHDKKTIHMGKCDEYDPTIRNLHHHQIAFAREIHQNSKGVQNVGEMDKSQPAEFELASERLTTNGHGAPTFHRRDTSSTKQKSDISSTKPKYDTSPTRHFIDATFDRLSQNPTFHRLRALAAVMVEKRKESPKRRRRASSSSTSGSSSTGSSSSGSSSSSSTTASRSPTPKKSRATTRPSARDERTTRRSPRRSRSPHRVQPKTEKSTVSSSRRSPSPRRRHASPPDRSARRRSRSPRHERPALSPPPARRERTPEPPPRRLCVRNLSRNITKAHMEEIFALFGALKSCELPLDRVHVHLPRGYGYVEYEKAEDAEKALKHMDGGQIDGLEIQCEMTLPFKGTSGGRGHSPTAVQSSLGVGIKRERSRSPVRRFGGRASPPRRPRRSRSPPPVRASGANQIPLGNNGRFRSRSPRR
uniref:RRM domain-containing protein n=1 Tax=Globodera rostochiensis TaxID=31243 RepID=A0A914HN37_GLORO